MALETASVDIYESEDKKEDGLLIKVKDTVFVDGMIKTSIPLETEAQDVVGAINELFADGTGGGDVLSEIYDSGGRLILKLLNENTEEITDISYMYSVKTFEEKISITNSKGTKTQVFTKKVVENLYNITGEEILSAVFKGKNQIDYYKDQNDRRIYLTAEENIENHKFSDTVTADTAAIAYVIAKSYESLKSLEELKDAYKKGAEDTEDIDGDEGITEVVEDEEIEGFEVYIPFSETEPITAFSTPFISDITRGIYFYCGEMTFDGVTDVYYLHIRVEMNKVVDGSTQTVYGEMVFHLYGASGAVDKVFKAKGIGFKTWDKLGTPHWRQWTTYLIFNTKTPYRITTGVASQWQIDSPITYSESSWGTEITGDYRTALAHAISYSSVPQAI